MKKSLKDFRNDLINLIKTNRNLIEEREELKKDESVRKHYKK